MTGPEPTLRVPERLVNDLWRFRQHARRGGLDYKAERAYLNRIFRQLDEFHERFYELNPDKDESDRAEG